MFLSAVLNCERMRVSKKFAGRGPRKVATGSMGKHVFRRNEVGPILHSLYFICYRILSNPWIVVHWKKSDRNWSNWKRNFLPKCMKLKFFQNCNKVKRFPRRIIRVHFFVDGIPTTHKRIPLFFTLDNIAVKMGGACRKNIKNIFNTGNTFFELFALRGGIPDTEAHGETGLC